MVITEPPHETALYTSNYKDAHNHSHLTVLVLGIGIGGQSKLLPSAILLLADILNVSETKNNSVITVYFAFFLFVDIKLTS